MTAVVHRALFNHAQVIGRAVEVLMRNLPLLATLTLLFYGLPKLGATLLAFGAADAPIVGPVFSMVRTLYGLTSALGFFAVQAMVVYVFVQDLQGRSPSLSGALRHGLQLLLPVLCLFVVLALGVVLGLVLLVVPGLMIATAWLVATPAAVVERLGVRAAIERSAWLTRDYRWPVFGLLAVMLLIRIAIGREFGDGLSANPIPLLETISDVVQSLLRDAFEIAFTLASALVVSSTYCELRMLKEGASPEDLGARLD